MSNYIKPDSREGIWDHSLLKGCTMVTLNNNCYLYGGFSSLIHNDLWELDLENISWIKVNEQTGDIP